MDSMLVAFLLLLAFHNVQNSFASLVSTFFSPDDLKYTFGVYSHRDVPSHRLVYPQLVATPRPALPDQPLFDLLLPIVADDEDQQLFSIATAHSFSSSSIPVPMRKFPLKSVTEQLLAKRLTMVRRNRADGGGILETSNRPDQLFDDCHYQHQSDGIMLAVSSCEEGKLKGTILANGTLWVIHPFPARHMGRMRRSATTGEYAPHVLYKRESLLSAKEGGGGGGGSSAEFCGIENTISSEELLENEAGVHEDVFVVGQKLAQESDLVVELAVFVDEQLWRHFSSRHGSLAWQKLQQYALTMLSNIQIMYKQPTAVPAITFRVVRYEVFQTQPSAMAAYLHENGNAQRYLDRFCRYQRSLTIQDWDHALMLTGYDIHRGYGANSISGIARLDGMCDPWNTCTLAEGLDFTSAFIGTHELGHSVGMRHDEPYCSSSFIMSSSLGPGKVTWSTCSLRDYQTFLQRMDGRRKNCLRTSLQREKLPLTDSLKPGQLYDSHEQCRLMHGPNYVQVTPRQDHYDGICHMMWCGQGSYGRIVTSHPALEGTFCGPSKWCSLGRCVPWTGFGAPLAPRPPVQQSASAVPSAPAAVPSAPVTPAPMPTQPARVDGQWSSWSAFDCQHCFCSGIVGSIGVTISQRNCSNPAPLNGGNECQGPAQRAAVCARKCANERESVNQHIASKCAEHKRVRSDPELTGTGSQLTRFPQRACKVFCDVQNAFGSQRNYRFYGDNLPDGAPCGWDRYCLNGECTELSCEDSLLLTTVSATPAGCPSAQQRCPLGSAASHSPSQQTADSIGQWGQWSLWSSCTASCGDVGVQIRSRACSINNRCEGEPSQSQACNRQECPTVPPNVAQWTEWTPWSQCSVSCGKGSQARYRRCQSAQGTIAFSCQGQTMELANCEEMPCVSKDQPQQQQLQRVGDTNNSNNNNTPNTDNSAYWTDWSVWSVCSVTCGPGFQTRTRVCSQPGACDGPWQLRLACNQRECGGQWNPWGVWSECSLLCGKGVRSRSRTCPVGANCPGPSVEQSFCNEQPCATAQQSTNGKWSAWSAWGPCSVSCGNGVKRRTRYCQRGNCPGNHFELAICNDGPCAVQDASWGGWGYWSACSESCGIGWRRRVRKCYGSGQCPGVEFERESCQIRTNC